MSTTTAGWATLVAGSALLLVGLLLLYRALLRDRARGRLRCPRCWYEMVGVPVEDDLRTCPECGRETRGERRLLRTRRFPRLAALALLALALGGVGITFPIWGGPAWAEFIPSAVLVRIAPTANLAVPLPTDPLQIEFLRRCAATPPEISEAAQLVYARRIVGADRASLLRSIQTRESWPTGEEVWISFDWRASIPQSLFAIDAVETARLHWEVRLSRTAGGGPGPWHSAGSTTPSRLVSLGAPPTENAQLQARLLGGDRVIWEGRVDTGFDVVGRIDDVLAPLEPDPQFDALLADLLLSRLLIVGETSEELWINGPLRGDGAVTLALRDVAFGAEVEIHENGKLVASGQFALPARNRPGAFAIGGFLEWHADPPGWGRAAGDGRVVTLRGNQSIALRDFDRNPDPPLRRHPSRWWAGEIVLRNAGAPGTGPE